MENQSNLRTQSCRLLKTCPLQKTIKLRTSSASKQNQIVLEMVAKAINTL